MPVDETKLTNTDQMPEEPELDWVECDDDWCDDGMMKIVRDTEDEWLEIISTMTVEYKPDDGG